MKFADVCAYAQEVFPERDPSEKGADRVTDWTYTFWLHPYQHCPMMVLYQGQKRLASRAPKAKPEVCWICVTARGDVISVPSRLLRDLAYDKTNCWSLAGFSFWKQGREKITAWLAAQATED